MCLCCASNITCALPKKFNLKIISFGEGSGYSVSWATYCQHERRVTS